MVCVFLFSYFISLVCSILYVSSYSYSITSDGFSISLIHRDSPESPFYNHSMTTYERHGAAARRSINRLHYLMWLSGAIATTPENDDHLLDMSTKTVPEFGEYIATFYIGNPPTQVTASMDTGSELSWLKGPPFYDPKKSSSYEELKCFGPCPSVSNCDQTSNLCTYNITYADRSTTSGIIAHETFGFDDPDGRGTMVGVASFLFGYATKTQGFDGRQDGIIGLNREPQSLISQLNIKRFSHCFTDKGSGSRMYFGSRAVISHFTTPIEPSMNNLYYVTLYGISVGDSLVKVPPGVFEFNKTTGTGVIFDTGTTYTYIPQEAYYPFKEEMQKHIDKPLSSDFCFNGTYSDLGNLPDVTYHFAGIDLKLGKKLVYEERTEGLLCVTVLTDVNLIFSIIGNIHMRTIWVGYDLESMKISLSEADCSNL